MHLLAVRSAATSVPHLGMGPPELAINCRAIDDGEFIRNRSPECDDWSCGRRYRAISEGRLASAGLHVRFLVRPSGLWITTLFPKLPGTACHSERSWRNRASKRLGEIRDRWPYARASSVSSKDKLLQLMAERSGAMLAVAKGNVFDALQSREALGSTGID